MVYAPPGSGYARPEDETSELPDSYEPMMEYPGTMRPGRTPENSPFHDLPIGDDDPDPVPWPHFQQIQWHHRWEPPHPHPVPMEDFIEQQGRWATPELEAAMRAGTRKASRMRREMEEEQKRGTLIMDDDEDDDADLPQDLGEGVFGSLGSTADSKIAAEATSPETAAGAGVAVDEGDELEDDMGLDDFLLDLGLDSMDDDDEEEEDDEDIFDDDDDDDVKPAMKKKQSTPLPPPPPPPPLQRPPSPAAKQALEDVTITDIDDDDVLLEEETTSTDVTASIEVEEEDDLDLGLDGEDDLDDSMEVPLEDFGDDDDSFDADDFFDDGGFDYDDGDFDGGDFDGGF
jgi:hypothetical protein